MVCVECIKSVFLDLKYFLDIPLMFCILSEKAHLRIFLPLCTFLKGSGVVFPTMAGRILPHPLPPPPPCSPIPSPRWPGHGWPGPGWPGLAWAGPATWLAGWRVRSLCVSAQPHVLLSPSLAVPSPSLLLMMMMVMMLLLLMMIVMENNRSMKNLDCN